MSGVNGMGTVKLPKTFIRKASIDKIFKRDGWTITWR